jgi:hypothetical protein
MPRGKTQSKSKAPAKQHRSSKRKGSSLRSGSRIGPGRAESGADYSRHGDPRTEKRGFRSTRVGDEQDVAARGVYGGSPGRGFSSGYGVEDNRTGDGRSRAGRRTMTGETDRRTPRRSKAPSRSSGRQSRR